MTGPNHIKELHGSARERITVKQAIDASEDPYADDYPVPAHEAYNAIWDCLQHAENPAELEFTCYHPRVPNSGRTTNLGQDTFWLLSYATQNSLFIGVFVAFFATLIGVFAGLAAGFLGGFADRFITLLADVFIVVPSLPILILMSSLLQGRASLILISIILIIFNWPWPARQMRSIALSMRERQFVNTARFSGSSTLHILAEEIVPHIFSWAMANFVNTVLVAIAIESGLAVIGLSSLEEATLGTTIYWALQHQAVLGQRWWWIGSPVVAIILLFIGLFLVSTGISSLSAERRGHGDA